MPHRDDLKTSIAVIKTFFGKGEEPPFDKYLPEHDRLCRHGRDHRRSDPFRYGQNRQNLFVPDMNYTSSSGRPGFTTSSLCFLSWRLLPTSEPSSSNRTGP
jgi:hypothetical protein